MTDPRPEKPMARDGTRRGRTTILTPRVHTVIIESIRAGNYMEVAARAAGVSKTALYVWIEKGHKQTRGDYRDFVDALQRAEADSEAESVKTVVEAGKRNWKAAMTYLERRHPDRWRRRMTQEIVGKDEGPVSYEHRLEVMPDAEFMAEWSRLTRVATRRPAPEADGVAQGERPAAGQGCG